MNIDLVFAAQLQTRAYKARERLLAGKIPAHHRSSAEAEIANLYYDAHYHLMLGLEAK